MVEAVVKSMGLLDTTEIANMVVIRINNLKGTRCLEKESEIEDEANDFSCRESW